MNLITLHRWEELPQYYVAECRQRGNVGWRLCGDELEEAVLEAAKWVGLNEEFRDAHGEEWDILIPESTLYHEFPDWAVCDRWYKMLGMGVPSLRARRCWMWLARNNAVGARASRPLTTY